MNDNGSGRYRVIETYMVDPDFDPAIVLIRGMTVYALKRSDYGSSDLHSYIEKEPHLSVSLTADGDYPFVTVPRRILVRCDAS